MGGSIRPPENCGFTFHYILSRPQGELQKSRETGAELHPPNDCVNKINNTLSGMKEPSVRSQNSPYKKPIQTPGSSTVHPVPDSSVMDKEEVRMVRGLRGEAAQSLIDAVHGVRLHV